MSIFTVTMKIALIGASGLVGNLVLRRLIESSFATEVRSFGRQELALNHSKLVQTKTDFLDVEEWATDWNFDVLVCCIGTTRKKTPDLAVYKTIDYGITVRVAQWAKKSGCSSVHLISSISANASSRNFYLKIKGETEEALFSLGFNSCQIYRPGMLIGKRQESRPAEWVGQKLSPLFDLFTFGGNFHSISADKLADAIRNNIEKTASGNKVLHYRDFLLLIQ
jgi:uncharacterized protein YbjT (DUF2867 family)